MLIWHYKVTPKDRLKPQNWPFIYSTALSPKSVLLNEQNKTKVISADLLDLDFDFEDIIMFGNISVLVTF